MICKNCGAEIKEGSRFCENCGTPVEGAGQKRPVKPQRPKKPRKPSSGALDSIFTGNNRLVIIIIAAVLFLALCLIGGFLWHSHAEKAKYDGNMQTVNDLIANGDYDSAEMVLNESIEMRPKEPQAYLTLSNVYIQKKEYRKSVTILKQGLEKTGKDDVFKQPIKQAEAVYSNNWKTAYREVLSQYDYEIHKYQEGPTEYSKRQDNTTALYDLNQDGTPELMFFAFGEYNAELIIYTFSDAGAVPLPYEWVFQWDGNGKDTDEGYHYAEAGGGIDYMVFTEKDQKGFTIVNKAVDDSTLITINKYEWDDGAFQNTDVIDYNSNLNIYGEDATYDLEYFHNGSSISDGEYADLRKDMLDNMDQVLFLTNLYGTDKKKEYERFVDVAGSKDILAMSYEDMMQQLKPETVQEEPASSDTSQKPDSNANDLFGKLSQGGFTFASGVGAWSTNVKFGPDGSFSGIYRDSNMGEEMETYPNGTIYECKFSGKFKDVKKTGDHEYTMTLDGDIELEHPADTDAVQDGTHIIYSEPYGLETLSSGSTVTVIEPGYPLPELEEAYLEWIKMSTGSNEIPAQADTYYLLNPDGGDYGGYTFLFYEGE